MLISDWLIDSLSPGHLCSVQLLVVWSVWRVSGVSEASVQWSGLWSSDHCQDCPLHLSGHRSQTHLSLHALRVRGTVPETAQVVRPGASLHHSHTLPYYTGHSLQVRTIFLSDTIQVQVLKTKKDLYLFEALITQRSILKSLLYVVSWKSRKACLFAVCSDVEIL